MKVALALSKKSHTTKITSKSAATAMKKANSIKISLVLIKVWEDSQAANSRTYTLTSLQWLVKRVRIVTDWRNSHLLSSSRMLASARRTLRFRTQRQARAGIVDKWSLSRISTTYLWTLLTSLAYRPVLTGLLRRLQTAMLQTTVTGSGIPSLYVTWRTGRRGMSTKAEICSSQISNWWWIMLRLTTAQLTSSRKKLRRFSKCVGISFQSEMAISWRWRQLSRWIIYEVASKKVRKYRWVSLVSPPN